MDKKTKSLVSRVAFGAIAMLIVTGVAMASYKAGMRAQGSIAASVEVDESDTGPKGSDLRNSPTAELSSLPPKMPARPT